MSVDGSRGQRARPPNGGDNLRPRRRPIHCPSNRLLRRPVSSNIGQSWGCCCGGSLYVRNGASACQNQFGPSSLLGPDIRHSSLHVFAGFSSLVRREATNSGAAGNASVSVIIPTFNGGSGLDPTIASLHRQTLRPIEIIVVDDGSTDETRTVAERARALGLADMVICPGTRCGRSAAINPAAPFSRGDLLLTVDADTVFEPTAVARLATALSDPRVAGASCNIAINNARDSLWTGLQSVEYLMSISAGRAILDVVDAIAFLSGACSMY